MELNVGLFLTKRARLEPEKTALVFEGESFSYREFNERSNRWAHAFLDMGVRKGERVGLLLVNRPEFLEAFFGLSKIGAVGVPLNWRLAPPEIEYICKDSGLKGLIYEDGFTEAVEAIRPALKLKEYVCVGQKTPSWAKGAEFIAQHPETEPQIAGGGDEPAMIMYTSGTTGRPKGAVLTHSNLFWASTAILVTLDFRPDDRVLVVLPLFHIGAFIFSVVDVHKGCTTVLMRAFEPLKMLETIQKERIDAFLAVPTMLQFMTQVPDFAQYLSGVRWLLSGAAPVPVPLIQTYMDHGVKIQQVYGLTETSGPAAVIGSEKALEKAGSTGLPFFHNEIRVVDERGRDASPGQVGEVLVRGPHVMKEYWKNPEATAETIKEGWLHTGDLGRLDEEGYLYIVDRVKDMIISGGENVYPAEVENVLYAHPAVAEVAVIGQPDEQWGEMVCAVVRAKEDAALTAEELISFCEGKLGRYKIPKRVILTDEPLPRNPAGKVLKRVLRGQFSGGAS